MEQAILDNVKLDKNIEDIMKMVLLTKEECKGLCEKAIAILQEEANVQPVRCPVLLEPSPQNFCVQQARTLRAGRFDNS